MLDREKVKETQKQYLQFRKKQIFEEIDDEILVQAQRIDTLKTSIKIDSNDYTGQEMAMIRLYYTLCGFTIKNCEDDFLKPTSIGSYSISVNLNNSMQDNTYHLDQSFYISWQDR